MHPRKCFAILAVGALSVIGLSGTAAAQCADPDHGGTRARIFMPGEGGGSGGSTLDLFTRLRMGVLMKYSWGQGTAVRPGTLRSSIAVLRERRGLMR